MGFSVGKDALIAIRLPKEATRLPLA